MGMPRGKGQLGELDGELGWARPLPVDRCFNRIFDPAVRETHCFPRLKPARMLLEEYMRGGVQSPGTYAMQASTTTVTCACC
jgi:hypothetical protein